MSDSQSGTGSRVGLPVLAPFRGPVRGAAPVGLRPPVPPGGRLTLPPFGAIRAGEPQQRSEVALAAVDVDRPEPTDERPWAKAPSAMLALAEHHRATEAREADEWYGSAEDSQAVSEPAPSEITEPAAEAFEAAVRDLPVYVPANVDVARFTPRVNRAIRPEPAPTPEAAMIPESMLEPTQEQVAAEWKAFVGGTPVRSRTPVRAQTPVLPMDAVLANEAAEEQDEEDVPAPPPHRMTPMRVTPMMVSSIPAEGNRAIAAALEAVAARVRRGDLVVHGTVPEADETHSMAAALAATLGALLGVGR